MQLLGWSHALSRVEITEGPVMHWYFDNINLPDSGANEAASHGFVSFRIKPHLPIAPGTVIANTANIYFDFNDPVITEPSVLTAEFSTGLHAANEAGPLFFPNPADQVVMVTMPAMARVQVMDLAGRTLLERGLQNDRMALPVGELPAGTYLLRVTNDEGRTFTRPLMKQ